MHKKADTPKHCKHERNEQILALRHYLTAIQLSNMFHISVSRVNVILRTYTKPEYYPCPYIYLEDYTQPYSEHNVLPC